MTGPEHQSYISQICSPSSNIHAQIPNGPRGVDTYVLVGSLIKARPYHLDVDVMNFTFQVFMKLLTPYV